MSQQCTENPVKEINVYLVNLVVVHRAVFDSHLWEAITEFACCQRRRLQGLVISWAISLLSIRWPAMRAISGVVWWAWCLAVPSVCWPCRLGVSVVCVGWLSVPGVTRATAPIPGVACRLRVSLVWRTSTLSLSLVWARLSVSRIRNTWRLSVPLVVTGLGVPGIRTTGLVIPRIRAARLAVPLKRPRLWALVGWPTGLSISLVWRPRRTRLIVPWKWSTRLRIKSIWRVWRLRNVCLERCPRLAVSWRVACILEGTGRGDTLIQWVLVGLTGEACLTLECSTRWVVGILVLSWLVLVWSSLILGLWWLRGQRVWILRAWGMSVVLGGVDTPWLVAGGLVTRWLSVQPTAVGAVWPQWSWNTAASYENLAQASSFTQISGHTKQMKLPFLTKNCIFSHVLPHICRNSSTNNLNKTCLSVFSSFQVF